MGWSNCSLNCNRVMGYVKMAVAKIELDSHFYWAAAIQFSTSKNCSFYRAATDDSSIQDLFQANMEHFVAEGRWLIDVSSLRVQIYYVPCTDLHYY